LKHLDRNPHSIDRNAPFSGNVSHSQATIERLEIFLIKCTKLNRFGLR